MSQPTSSCGTCWLARLLTYPGTGSPCLILRQQWGCGGEDLRGRSRQRQCCFEVQCLCTCTLQPLPSMAAFVMTVWSCVTACCQCMYAGNQNLAAPYYVPFLWASPVYETWPTPILTYIAICTVSPKVDWYNKLYLCVANIMSLSVVLVHCSEFYLVWLLIR